MLSNKCPNALDPKAHQQIATHRRTQLCWRVAATSVVAEPKGACNVKLPDSLLNSVVVLDAPNPAAPGGVTKVYLLAMSHVSKVSVDQVRQLVRSVRPEVLGLELCKDRLGLLVDGQEDSVARQLWHCRRIMVEGLPAGPEWPKEEQVKQLLRCQPGKPVSSADIEADVNTLLATGLFRSGKPACQNAGMDEAPAFIIAPTSAAAPSSPAPTLSDAPLMNSPAADLEGEGLRLQAIPPLGAIKFVVQERVFPPITTISARIDSSLKSAGVPQADVDRICQVAQASSQAAGGPQGQAGLPSLTCLLRARLALKELFAARAGGQGVVVSFEGADTGKVEVTVRAAREGDALLITGFEGSAQGGQGWGIETFRPTKNLVKLSNKMFLPPEYVEGLLAQAQGIQTLTSLDTASSLLGTAAAASLPAPTSQSRAWSPEELSSYVRSPPLSAGAAADLLGDVLTGLYARHQTNAAKKVGLTPGSAWQAALAAATEVGTQQVMLIDRPTIVTEPRLAAALWQHAGARIVSAVALVVGSIVAAVASSSLSESWELAGVAGAAALATGLVWPLVGPLAEVQQLAGRSAEAIEDAVAVKQPVAGPGVDLSQPLRLFGEDALLDWPGAMAPVIRERDTFMVRAAAAAATGAVSVAPAFVRGQQEGGRPLWRFMMPEWGNSLAAPVGLGDGAVQPVQGPRAVVCVVGSAHVRGMVREWDDALRTPGQVDSLLTL
ncbi:hypothetical protein V8C86DRAFT_2518932 [Haematococcus lacustris]